MKTTTLLLPALLALLAFAGCQKRDDTNAKVSSLKIQAVANNNAAATKATVPRDVAAADVIATLNLESYNAKTGAIIFSNPLEELQKVKNATTPTINIFLDDKQLFSLKTLRPTSNSIENTPILYYDYNGVDDPPLVIESKWYIWSGHPQGVVLGGNERFLQADAVAERNENFKKIEAGWNLFIEALKKEGKYIE